MFPFLSLTKAECESVLKHVGINEKFALMKCHRYFREYVFQFGPWPEIIEQLTIGHIPKAPEIPMMDYDSFILKVIIDKNGHHRDFFFPPAFARGMMKPMVGLCSQPGYLVCSDDEKRSVYALLGKIRSCRRFLVEYDRETPTKNMVDNISRFLECFKSRDDHLIYDLRIGSSLPMIRQLIDGLNAKVINSYIVSLPFLTDLHVGGRKNAKPKEIRQIRKYFSEALQKPIFSKCRMFATDNVVDMFADGLKKANFKMIYSQEAVMEGFWTTIAIFLTKGLPNDQSLTVLSTGYCYGPECGKFCDSERNLDGYTRRIAKKYGLEKINPDEDEAKMMLELVADPRKNDCEFLDHCKWIEYKLGGEFEFEFDGKTKLFYKKRIETIGKTLVMMASLHDVFMACQTVVYLFKYWPE